MFVCTSVFDAVSSATNNDIAIPYGVHGFHRLRGYAEVTSKATGDGVQFGLFRLYRSPSDGTLSGAGEGAMAAPLLNAAATTDEGIFDVASETQELPAPDGVRVRLDVSPSFTSPVTAYVKLYFEFDDN